MKKEIKVLSKMFVRLLRGNNGLALRSEDWGDHVAFRHKSTLQDSAGVLWLCPPMAGGSSMTVTLLAEGRSEKLGYSQLGINTREI